MTFQVWNVSGPLGSVRRIVEAGNRVVFDSEGSYIEHKGTGTITRINDEGGKYILKLWVHGKGKGKTIEGNNNQKTVSSGRFHVLTEEEEEDFAGLGEDWI